MDNLKKKYLYKVYNSVGTYITTWSDDVISLPSFRSVINGGGGQLTITLARKYDDFGENIDVAVGNRVELWGGNKDYLAGKKLFSGYISQYTPTIEGTNQSVQVILLGFITELSYRILKDSSGNTSITYTGVDPSAILRDIIDKYRADGGTSINYTAGSIANTGTVATYTFSGQTIKSCLDVVLSLCPVNWYYYIDPDNILWLKQSVVSVADRAVNIGQNVQAVQSFKRLENIANRVFVIGGGTTRLYNRYDRAGSQTIYGIYEYVINNNAVTDNATADLIAKRYLDQNASPEVRTLITILDNPGVGNCLENYKVGESLQIKNFKYSRLAIPLWDKAKWDTDVWDNTISTTAADIMIIVSLQYDAYKIQIECTSRFPEVEKVIQGVSTQVSTIANSSLPASPTQRTV